MEELDLLAESTEALHGLIQCDFSTEMIENEGVSYKYLGFLKLHFPHQIRAGTPRSILGPESTMMSTKSIQSRVFFSKIDLGMRWRRERFTLP